MAVRNLSAGPSLSSGGGPPHPSSSARPASNGSHRNRETRDKQCEQACPTCLPEDETSLHPFLPIKLGRELRVTSHEPAPWSRRTAIHVGRGRWIELLDCLLFCLPANNCREGREGRSQIRRVVQLPLDFVPLIVGCRRHRVVVAADFGGGVPAGVIGMVGAEFESEFLG